jgi:hypothetical protein
MRGADHFGEISTEIFFGVLRVHDGIRFLL